MADNSSWIDDHSFETIQLWGSTSLAVAWTLGDMATKDKRPVGLGSVQKMFPSQDLGRGMNGNDQDD